jgi:quercetin dioxygenase-like cupin family protein
MEPLAHGRVAELRRRALLLEADRGRRAASLRHGRGSRPTRGTVYPLAALLSVITAAALLALVAALPLAAGPAPTAGAANGGTTEVAIRRFYAALDAALATGDQTALDATVWPELRVQGDDGQTWGVADLREQLGAIHAAQPGLRLRVEEVVAGDERGVAQLEMVGGESGQPLAVPEVARVGGAAADRLQVLDGRVVAYGGGLVGVSVPRTLLAGTAGLKAQAAVPATSPRPQSSGTVAPAMVTPELERVEMGPGSGLPPYIADGPVLFGVEAGEALVSSLVVAAARVQTVERALGEGEQVVLPAGTSHWVRAGPDGATLLVVEMLPPPVVPPGRFSGRRTRRQDSEPVGTASQPAVEVTSLVRGTIELGDLDATGGVAVSLDRFTLEPGRHRLVVGAGRPGLLAVESGRGVLAAPLGQAEREGGAGPVTVLTAGAATSLAPGPTPLIDNIGADPLVVLVLTLAPGRETEAPAAPGGVANGSASAAIPGDRP